eukprot:m.98899 g.98899  ORF g.98899 m.98899 type:complete len:325 (-) comp15304_c0_seq1:116-1090(-)
MASPTVLPNGVWPVMLTPFNSMGKVDEPVLKRLTEWYIQSGCAGLFPVAQSGEMYSLSDDERVRVAQVVVATASQRVPVVACATVQADEFDAVATAARVKKLAPVVSAVVIVPSCIVTPEEDDVLLKSRIEDVLRLTADDGIPLGIYECPVPYHRLLTPKLLSWLVSTGRFVFIKDTSRQTDLISSKLQAVQDVGPSSFRWYNGNVTTLLHSLKAGSHGYSGVSGNFYPWVHVWLTKNWNTQPEKAVQVQRFLTVAESLVKTKYPLSAKMYLKSQYGLDIQVKCRGQEATFNEEELTKLTELRLMMEDLCSSVGIQPVPPPMTP